MGVFNHFMNFAQVTLIGHIGRDPDVTYTGDGIAAAHFALAVNRKWGKDEKEKTTWYHCTAFHRLAEAIAGYVSKGDLLFMQGDLHPRDYRNKDGVHRTSLNVLVGKFQLLMNKPPVSTFSPEQQRRESTHKWLPHEDLLRTMSDQEVNGRYVEERLPLYRLDDLKRQGKPRPPAMSSPNTTVTNRCRRELERRGLPIPRVNPPGEDSDHQAQEDISSPPTP